MSYSLILILLLLFGTIGLVALGAAVFAGNRSRSSGSVPVGDDGPIDATSLLQDLHEGMIRMEQRVASLETLLLERTSSKQDHATKDV